MSPRGFNPKDYEYDGTDVEQELMRSDAAAASRQARFKATSAVTTVVLAAAGLVGGAAFAMSQVPASDPSQAPVVATTVDANAINTAVDTATPSPSATADDSAAADANTGKTIAVPPAAFDDKKGERDFHTSPAAGSASSSTATPTPAASQAAPSFGGGGSDDGGEHHHHRNPAPGTTGSPTFNNSDDGGGDD